MPSDCQDCGLAQFHLLLFERLLRIVSTCGCWASREAGPKPTTDVPRIPHTSPGPGCTSISFLPPRCTLALISPLPQHSQAPLFIRFPNPFLRFNHLSAPPASDWGEAVQGQRLCFRSQTAWVSPTVYLCAHLQNWDNMPPSGECRNVE